MIQFHHVRFAYPFQAVRSGERTRFTLDIREFAVEQGGCVALTGASGSGKTTLLHLASGLVTAEQGEITTASAAITHWSEKRRAAFRITTIGLVFQSFELLPHLTAMENVLLPFRLHASLKLTQQVRDRAVSLANSLGIESSLQLRPTQLSQGEQQRVAIARSLITEPKVVLADEPTGNLDPHSKQVVVDLLLNECRRRRATLLMATHDLEITDRFDQTWAMSDFAVSDRVAS